MKRDAPDEETDGSVLEAANAAAKRVASKWDIGAPAEGEAAAAPPAGIPSLQDLMASAPAPGEAAATIDAVLGAHPSCADGPEPLVDWETTQVQLKMHLHGDVVAALLSHEGATLVSIRTNSGCRIKILPADMTDPMHRKLHMGGTQEAVCAALGYILAEMQKSCATNPAVCDSTGYKVRMLVRSDSCGSIIGKAGSVIAQIRQQSGAVVKMDQALTPPPPWLGLATHAPTQGGPGCSGAHRPKRQRLHGLWADITPPPSPRALTLCRRAAPSRSPSRDRSRTTAASPSTASCRTCTWRCSRWLLGRRLESLPANPNPNPNPNPKAG